MRQLHSAARVGGVHFAPRRASRATPGTHILFDDYSERGYYHLVEALVEPQQRTDRQAVFVVPKVPDRTVAEDLLARFAYVMD